MPMGLCVFYSFGVTARPAKAQRPNQGRKDVYQHPDSNRRLGTRRQRCPARHCFGHADRHQSYGSTVSAPFHVFTTDLEMVLEDTAAQYQAGMQQRAEKILGAVAHLSQAAGVACETVHVEHEHPYQAIIDTAASRGCDLIVMASHGRRGISAIVLGSETVKVLTHSKIPVLVHR